MRRISTIFLNEAAQLKELDQFANYAGTFPNFLSTSPPFFKINTMTETSFKYRAIWEENPHTFPKNELPSYSPKTATTGLCRHLTKKHVPEYMKACKDFGWDMHRDLDPDAGPLPAPANDLKECEPFTLEVLLRHIINFIIADDQVFICHYSDLYTPVHQRC